MSDSVYLGLKARQLEDSPAYQPISCVRLTIGGEDENGNPIVCQAGNPKSGRILETSNPLIWDKDTGNRVAKDILTAVQGYAYKPFTADGAIINPAVEIGDAVEVGDVYSVIADVETTFSPLMSANISAPVGSDIDHEYPYESSESYAQRRTAAELGQLKTEFIVQNGEVSWAISQIGAEDQEGSIWNKLTSVKTTVDGITVRTEKDVKTIIGTTKIQWANVAVTPEQIKAEVKEYFDASGAANTAYKDAKREAKEYTDGRVDPIESQYTSAIEQTAREIKATVAASETIWNVYSLPPTEQNKFAVYGYGRPSDENSPDNKTRPSAYNGKYYLDQSTGQYWRSNGMQWSPQGTITEKLAVSQQSAITQNKNSITSVIESVDKLNRRVTSIAQTDSDITLSVYSDQNGTTYFKLSDGSGEIQTSEFNFTTDIVNVAGNLAAKYIAAGVSITSPYISGATITSSRFSDPNRVTALAMGNETWSDGYLWFGPYGSASYPSLSNSYFRVRGYGNYVEIDLGGKAFIGTQQNSWSLSLGGTWDFSQANKVIMPDGTIFQ